MALASAGILLYRRRPMLEVLLVHPGGPFWAKKDIGGWSVPKGLIEPGEDPELAARREFEEETGMTAEGPLHDLGAFSRPGGKVVHVYALEGDFDPASLASTTFTMEWPPRSGRQAEFPEIDRAAWFTPEDAAMRLHKGQADVMATFLRVLG